ncbi:MAG: hypothetical protein GEU96_06920 [Propionibacteriales bacterium]|nr:hypothetical protein [Propionibacteriales bacterium]
MTARTFDVASEFDRQYDNLVDRGYLAATDLSAGELKELVEPLRALVLERADDMTSPTRARVPFVLVISKRLVPADRSMPLTDHKGKPGFVSSDTEDIHRFEPIESVDVPAGQAYVLVDIDRGAETLNATPDDALAAITAQGRTPLTYDEGIAFITAFPDSLEKNNCFSLVASRCGDRRVPALWISNALPKLGWCWAGNPHTWLGSASCAGRAGADA